MAPSVVSLFLLVAATSVASHDLQELKSLHFELFQHETINTTAYITVAGVAGPPVTQTTTPFGTFMVFQDILTTTADPSSTAVGVAEGTSTTTAMDGLRMLSVGKMELSLKDHKGSISIVGVTHNLNPSDHPVVGGTGDFLMVQGIIRSSPVSFNGATVVYKIEFHLYWPPYAAEVSPLSTVVKACNLAAVPET